MFRAARAQTSWTATLPRRPMWPRHRSWPAACCSKVGAGRPDARGAARQDETCSARSGSDLLTFQVKRPRSGPGTAARGCLRAPSTCAIGRLGSEALDAGRARRAAPPGQPRPGADERLAGICAGRCAGSRPWPPSREPARRVVRRADEAEKVHPRPVRNTAIGLALGLVLGVALAFVRDLFDRRVRSADEAASLVGLPLLARLPGATIKRRGASRLPLVHEPDGPEADGYRTLMYRLQMANAERRAQVILVTSAVEGEGKTTTSANLALALARAGHNTALVELDLWRPALHRVFGFTSRLGLTDVLLGRSSVDAALVRADSGPVVGRAGGGNGGDPGVGSLAVLPAGHSPSHPSDLIALPTLPDVLASLRVRYETVILDAPPLVQGGDGIALAAMADAVLVVTRLGGVHRDGLLGASPPFAGHPVPAIGLAVTDAELDELGSLAPLLPCRPGRGAGPGSGRLAGLAGHGASPSNAATASGPHHRVARPAGDARNGSDRARRAGRARRERGHRGANARSRGPGVPRPARPRATDHREGRGPWDPAGRDIRDSPRSLCGGRSSGQSSGPSSSSNAACLPAFTRSSSGRFWQTNRSTW